MGTYKVLQDIEAEDKLLGPLTLRQFVYAAIVVVLGFIGFNLLPVSFFLVLPLVPPMIFFAMLAAPFGHDQSSEIWLLAKIRFALKPRKRIWDQDGIQELVTITVPKKIERILTNNLSQHEVKSRLQALANTLDSRGWAVKNVNVNMFAQPAYLTAMQSTDTDRLVGMASLPQDVPSIDVQAVDDMLDASSNPTAQHLDTMIQQSSQAHHQDVMAKVQPVSAQNPSGQGQVAADYWFMNQSDQPASVPSGQTTFQNGPLVTSDSTSDDQATAFSTPNEAEQALLDKLHAQQAAPSQAYSHLKTLQPIDKQTSSSQQTTNTDQNTTPAGVNPDILRLASNDDLNVATISREANRNTNLSQDDDEVVISLR